MPVHLLPDSAIMANYAMQVHASAVCNVSWCVLAYRQLVREAQTQQLSAQCSAASGTPQWVDWHMCLPSLAQPLQKPKPRHQGLTTH